MIKNITVLGAGHGGCAAAADLGLRGLSVRLHARNEERLEALRRQGGVKITGIHDGLVPVDLITTNLADAVRDANLIMLVVPSVAHAPYAHALAPLIDGSQPIFLNPGHFGYVIEVYFMPISDMMSRSLGQVGGGTGNSSAAIFEIVLQVP